MFIHFCLFISVHGVLGASSTLLGLLGPPGRPGFPSTLGGLGASGFPKNTRLPGDALRPGLYDPSPGEEVWHT